MIFITNGVAKSGKDTFADFLKLEGSKRNIIVRKYSTIDEIKECAMMLGWNGIKSDSSRKFLSDLKFLASKHFDYSFNYIKDIISKHEMFTLDKTKKIIIIIDIRESEEIKRVVETFPQVKTILIKRETTDFVEITSNEADNDVYNYNNYDYTLINDSSLEDFKVKSINFLDNLNL